MNEKCLADMKHQKADYQKRSTSFLEEFTINSLFLMNTFLLNMYGLTLRILLTFRS